ncbi:centrosomal protein POC5-like [Oncorhynchus mykiss]|uniref:centrosomal protein POC5-like n=1 Tax=Oncorhynchus mykiss TaxID=8022 RepID=UPI00187878C0|nr:centrosomal protein POC5-like [Oncorhynchus mykiss]
MKPRDEGDSSSPVLPGDSSVSSELQDEYEELLHHAVVSPEYEQQPSAQLQLLNASQLSADEQGSRGNDDARPNTQQAHSARLAEQHYSLQLKRKVWAGWHALVQGRWKQKSYHVDAAQAEIQSLRAERERYEESMKTGRAQCALTKVARCTVFPPTHWCGWLPGWMRAVLRSSAAWLGCVSEDA